MQTPQSIFYRKLKVSCLPVLLCLLLVQPSVALAQEIGRAPDLGTDARDVSASFKLPPLRDQPDSELAKQLGGLQVSQRARALKLHSHSADEAWAASDGLLSAARVRVNQAVPEGLRLFSGTRASELNVLLQDPSIRGVKVVSPKLDVDEPVQLRRAKCWLDLARVELRAVGEHARFLLRVEHTSEVVVSGGAFVGGDWGVLVNGSRDVTLVGGRYEGLRGGGVVLHDAPGAVLARTVLTRNGEAAVLVHGDTVGGVLLDNEIVGNFGSSNWNAGVVISDRNGPVADDPRSILNPDRYGVREQAMPTRLHPPRRNVLAFNRVALNASSGIYCDGSVESVIFANTVEGNAKEGVCLDNGSTANVLAMNLVRANGKRWGKTDAELRLDFVEAVGRLPDGSSAAKTPGISLDNSLYNVVYGNQIERNYGGGVKMVRTAFFNVVGLNTVVDNNEGANGHYHFFGVELGAAKADVAVSDLDFTPCRGNILFGNTVRGTHYAGIFFGLGSTDNDIFDNSIFGATDWAMEQVRPQPNASLNNLTNLPLRNIDAGLDANLLKSSKGRMD